MTAYITVDQIKEYLDQLADTFEHDDVLEAIAERATGFVNAYLGTTTNITVADSTTRTLYGDGGLTLTSDVPMSSVTLVETLDSYTVPDYIEQDGMLLVTDSSGVIARRWYPALGGSNYWPYTSGWSLGVPYTVTATFGYTADEIAVVTEATLQTAVQLWRYKDSGGSETVGNGMAVITVRAGWTPLVKEGLDAIKRRMRGNSVGVY